MSGYNNFGVPWYARPETPPIRPKPRTILLESERTSAGAAKMVAYGYVRNFVKTNWKCGDRFFYTTELHPTKNYRSQHRGKTGIFSELKMIGTTWWVAVEWDDPNYRPNTGKKAGMFDFYHFAFKIPENAVEFDLMGFQLLGVKVSRPEGEALVIMQSKDGRETWYPIMTPLDFIKYKNPRPPSGLYMPLWEGEPIAAEDVCEGWSVP